MLRLFAGTALSFLLSTAAFALTLEEAKGRGLVGEANSGYLGFVVSSPDAETRQLVEDVNRRRKDKFSETARRNNLQLQQVEYRFYQRAVEETAAGNYVQDAAGNWVVKK